MRLARSVVTWLAVLAAVTVIAACADEALIREANPSTLAGTTWLVASVNGHSPVAGTAPSAAFTDAQVTGSAGCNGFGGRYRYDPSDGSIAFVELGQTAMLCVDPARNAFESALMQAIGSATTASMDPAGRLVLSGPGGEVVLVVGPVGS
jgi:heat shock protein HslJ